MSRRSALLGMLLLAAPAFGADAVQVTDPGRGTPTLLRVAPAAPEKQSAAFSLDLATTSRIGTQEVVVDLPPVTASLDVDARPRAAGGAEVRFAYRDVTAGTAGDLMGRMAVGPLVASLTGLSGTLTVTPDGEVATDAPKTADGPQGSEQGLDPSLWYPRLPDVPVGVGAVWVHRDQGTDAHGFAWTSTTTYRLVALDEGRATIAVETERRSGAGRTRVQGTEVEVDGIVTRGTGTSVLAVGGAFPEAGSWTLDIEMTLKLLGRPTTQSTRLDLRLGRTP